MEEMDWSVGRFGDVRLAKRGRCFNSAWLRGSPRRCAGRLKTEQKKSALVDGCVIAG